jgi:monoamine oxidase
LRPADLIAVRRLILGSKSIRSLGAAATSGKQEKELDSRSVADWFDDLGLSSRLRHLADCFHLEGSGGADPRDNSLLQFANFLCREGSALRFAMTGMGLNSHILEGTGALCAYLAEELGNERLRLCTAVTAIEQDDHDVAVHTDNGDIISGDHVVVAVPTPVLADISFTPESPEKIQSANAAVHYGQDTKIAAVVEPRRPWQVKAFVGGKGVRAGWRTRRVLYGFTGTNINDVDTVDVTEDLCRGFGVDPKSVEQVELVRWAQDPFTRGTYVYIPPGRYADFRRSLPHQHRRVSFAGAERSSWPTCMEGAVESGELASTAVIAG